jgi:hypothetical protein
MVNNLPIEVVERLKQPFEQILSRENFGELVNDIAEQISVGQLTAQNLENLLRENGQNSIESIKNNILDMLLAYVNFILEDNCITSNEAENVHFLKRFFKIREGDFYSKKYHQIEEILNKQFEYMYQNNVIDTNEALQKVELQQLFDLSYDQFLELSRNAVQGAIERGANVIDLDTFIKSN